MTARLRVLHLEDDPVDSELVRASLEAEGIACDLERLDTRADFLAALDCGGFDIIFADYSLPSFDGLAALEIVREKCPDIPFIFVTGKMGEELAIDSLKSGATDYVLKQRLARLVPAVRRATSEQQERVKRRQAEGEVERYQERLEELVRERTAELEKANELLKAAYADMESFSYSASHDLRKPVITIDGFSRVIMEDYGDKLDEEGRRLLNSIRESAGKMGRMIEDILAFSRVSTKEVRKAEINMEALTKRVLEELGPEIGDREIQLVVKSSLPAYGDPAMVRQVVFNLLSNAVKYTSAREKAIIEIGGDVKENENVYYIKDNGVGFDMAYAAKLFGLFQRLHSHKEFTGTGVGLAIVKRIVEKHGGRVWAEGKVNEGATFYFSLPEAC